MLKKGDTKPSVLTPGCVMGEMNRMMGLGGGDKGTNSTKTFALLLKVRLYPKG